MNVAAIIIDDRKEIAQEAIARHKPFIPSSWHIFHIEPPYAGGIYSLKFARDYNAVLTNPAFWQGCRYDRVLIFQHDSGLLRHGIEQFLEWDFIGAPIKNIPGCMNGGLSIRNPKVMHEICVKHPYQGMAVHGNEDIYFCNHIKNKPSKKIAQSFSIETEFAFGSIGYHAIDKYLTPDQVKQVLNQ
jgi:hypothetical protein